MINYILRNYKAIQKIFDYLTHSEVKDIRIA